MKKRIYQTFKWIFECIAIVSMIVTIIIAAVPYMVAAACNILKELLEDAVRRIERKEERVLKIQIERSETNRTEG